MTDPLHLSIRAELLRSLVEPLSRQRDRPERLQEVAEVLACVDDHLGEIHIRIQQDRAGEDPLRTFALLLRRIRRRQGGDGLVCLMPDEDGAVLTVAGVR